MEKINIKKDSQGWTLTLPNSIDWQEDSVYLKQVGSAIVLLPAHDPWRVLWESLSMFSEDCFEDFEIARANDLPQEREDLFVK